VALKHAARRGARRATIVGMMGKLSKMADGRMQTHAAGSEVNMELLATLAAELGASEELQARVRAANTARHVLEMCAAEGMVGVTARVCRRVVEHASRHAGGELGVRAVLVDFGGALLARFPEEEVA
jgi:cobalt-precorrin-5B (C1)-methyltransferase